MGNQSQREYPVKVDDVEKMFEATRNALLEAERMLNQGPPATAAIAPPLTTPMATPPPATIAVSSAATVPVTKASQGSFTYDALAVSENLSWSKRAEAAETIHAAAHAAADAAFASEAARMAEARAAAQAAEAAEAALIAAAEQKEAERRREIENLRETEVALKSEIIRLNDEIKQQREATLERTATLNTLQQSLENHRTEIEFLKQTSTRIVSISSKMGLEKDQEIERLRNLNTQKSDECTAIQAELNEQKEKLGSKAGELDELNAQIQQLHQTIKALRTELSNTREHSNVKLSGLLDDNWAKDLEVNRLKEVTLNLQIEVKNLQAANEQTSARLIDAADEIERTEFSLQEVQSDRAHLNEKCQKFATELETEKAKSQALGQNLDFNAQAMRRLEDKFEAQASELNQAHRFAEQQALAATENLNQLKFSTQMEINRLQAEKETAVSQACALQSEIEMTIEKMTTERTELETALTEMQAKINLKCSELSEAESREESCRLELFTLNKDLYNLNADRQRFEIEIKALKANLLDAQNQLKDREHTIITGQQEIAHLEDKVAQQTAEIVRRSLEMNTATEHISDLKKTIDSIQRAHKAEVDAYAARETDYRDELNHLRADHIELQTDNRDASENLERMKERLEDMRLEHLRFEQLKQKTEKQAFELDLANRQLEAWNQQLENRELQLRRYATALTKEKTEALRFSKQIADEIKAAQATHPLKDYLKLTEFELSKIEVQLKKTPMLSPDRSKLETALSQLIDQREFLKTVLGSTQRQLEKQAMEFMKLIQSGRLAPVPPPPPRPATVMRSGLSEASQTARSAEASQAEDATVNVKWQGLNQDLN